LPVACLEDIAGCFCQPIVQLVLLVAVPVGATFAVTAILELSHASRGTVCACPLGLLLRVNGQIRFQQEFTNNAVCVQRLFVCEVAVSIAANRK
jgi:hypothetical protein